MNLRKLGAIAVAVLAINAVFASISFAGSPETRKASWTYFDGFGIKSMTSESILCSNPSFSFKFESVVAGILTQILASGIECPESKLVNKSVGGVNMATAEGKVRFNGVSVLSPVGCTTPATNTTNALVADLQMDFFESERGWVKFAPASGPEGTLATLTLEGCAAKGKYPIKGTVFFQAINKTSKLVAQQDAESNATAHGPSALTLGPEPATLTGTVRVGLFGANFGSPWGAAEK